METKSNAVVWFEIPAADMYRAISFYENSFGIKLSRNQMGPLDMAWFPSYEGGPDANGALVHNKDFYAPSHHGTLVYLASPSGNLNADLKSIEKNGGKVLVPKTLITEDVGYMCVFEDSEGNRIAIHSPSC